MNKPGNHNWQLKKLALGGNVALLSEKYTDKKEKKIFLIYKEIQMGAVAKSYMRKSFLIYEEMRKYLVIHRLGGR
jgi:hypothetical protein